MSKSNMNTRGKILDKALELFNERGIEYVGLRELAGILNMRVGNITYYFPTKDDLVYELSLELSKKNAETIVAGSNLSITGFLHMLLQAIKNQLQFKCLLLSFVHLVQQNEFIATSYKKTQQVRNATIRANIDSLVAGGYLHAGSEDQKQFLVSTVSLISRFWISEAAISFRQYHREELITHYLALVTQLLLPYCTPKGKKDIQSFLHNSDALE